MASSLQQIVDDVTTPIKSLGLDVNPSSRVGQMARVLKFRENIEPTDPDYEIALEALRDIHQLGFFFNQISSQSQLNECRPVVERLLKDSVVPRDDQVQTPGRDAQAELFVYSVCRAGDLQPKWVEPDIECNLAGVQFCVAVKRIKDKSQLIKRVRKGSKQILRSGVPGIVDIDITLAMNRENYRFVTGLSGAQLRSWSQFRLKSIVDSNTRWLQRAMQSKPVRGIMLHDHLVVWLQTERRWVARSMTYAVKNQSNNDGEQFELERFAAGFLRGLPNLVC